MSYIAHCKHATDVCIICMFWHPTLLHSLGQISRNAVSGQYITSEWNMTTSIFSIKHWLPQWFNDFFFFSFFHFVLLGEEKASLWIVLFWWESTLLFGFKNVFWEPGIPSCLLSTQCSSTTSTPPPASWDSSRKALYQVLPMAGLEFVGLREVDLFLCLQKRKLICIL